MKLPNWPDDHPPLPVGDQREAVALLADTRRHGGADQSRVHLDAGVPQRVLDDVERDRVDRDLVERGRRRLKDGGGHQRASGRMRMLPTRSTVPAWPLSISVVESISMTIAGPGTTSPARSFERS